MEKKDIASLVERARNKDKSALDELYNATHKQAYFVAIKMTNNEDDAMDILQDSYVKAFTKLDKLENPEQFQSWFNQIVANGCRDFFKKKKAIYFSETEDEDGGTIADTFEDDDESIMPDKSLDNEETKRLVMKIIEGLSEEQKLCVLMYYYENMSVADIAESLECSTGTVKSRLNYARQKIKSEVENLEKTQGIKLYSIAPIPFVIWVLTRTAEATVVPESVTAAVLGTATTAAGATAAGAAGTAGAATTAGTAAGTTAGTAGTTAATAATGKIIAAVTAGVLVVGGGTAAAITVANANNKPTAVVETIPWEERIVCGYYGNGLFEMTEKDESGKIILKEYRDFKYTLDSSYTYEYDQEDLLTSRKRYDENGELKTIYVPDEYDEYKNVISETICKADGEKTEYRYTYEYNDNNQKTRTNYCYGKIIREYTIFNYDDSGILREKTKYDSDNKIIKQCEYDSNGYLIVERGDYPDDIFARIKYRTYEYDENGYIMKISRINNSDDTLDWVAEFDTDRNMRRYSSYTSGVLSMVHEYDANGNELKWEVYYSGVLDNYNTYEYDENNRLIKECRYNKSKKGFLIERFYEIDYYPDGTIKWKKEIYNYDLLNWDNIQEYNTDGKIIKQSYYNHKTGALTRYITYEYNAEGKKIKECEYKSDGTLKFYRTYENGKTKTFHPDGTPY